MTDDEALIALNKFYNETYNNGESSGYFDWIHAITENADLPDSIDPESPTEVGMWVGELQAEATASRRKLAAIEKLLDDPADDGTRLVVFTSDLRAALDA